MREPTSHRQVVLEGHEVDERLAPLLEALWKQGFQTDYSCQGGPHHLGHLPPDVVSTRAYISFVDLEQSFVFIRRSLDLLGSSRGPVTRLQLDVRHALREIRTGPQPRLERDPDQPLRGAVRFAHSQIDLLEDVWVDG